MPVDTDYAVRKTREYLDSILVEERLIDSVIASQDFELYGKHFSTPIMTPAFSHLKTFVKEQKNGMYEYSKAAKHVNAVNWVGMCENEEFEEIQESKAETIRIIKPYADRDKIFSQIVFAEKCGALAVGIDIDHIFGTDGKCDCVMGETMACQTLHNIKEYVEATRLPFVIKGVLSVQDAVKCAEAGVQGIVVSHHHGRLPFAVPPLMVLPDIVKAVFSYKQMRVFVDCGIDSGYDAFKALALGADAVSAGRVLMPELAKEGSSGVEKYLNKMKEQLAYIMAFCGCSTLEEIDSSVLYRLQGKLVSE
ncbi:MAG TPA: alpha-hydroxy-acid oxidizing protein [Lachnospiraceae bacterium]|nr:alpha-hydroxy-acid oxidizing protein [Lachnospiraceae bacterium]